MKPFKAVIERFFFKEYLLVYESALYYLKVKKYLCQSG